MNSVSKKSMMSIVSKLLILVILAKVATLSLLYFLPSSGVDKNEQKSYAPEYKRYNFTKIVQKEKKRVVKQKKKEPVKKVEVVPSSDVNELKEIATLVLKGLYGSKKSSFVFVSKKSKPKVVKMLKIGESFEGYKLVRVEGNIAVFNLNSKEYVLRFGKVDVSKYKNSADNKTSKKVSKRDKKEKINSKKPIKREDAATVGRSEIQYYAKNFKQIWKDISIIPLKKKGKIVGFKVTRIKKNTPFARLGLKVGDVIIRANNIELTSYKDALKLYEKIDDLNAIEIVVLRNNEEVELVYEIY